MAGNNEPTDEQAEDPTGTRGYRCNFVESVTANYRYDSWPIEVLGRTDMASCGIDNGTGINVIFSRDEIDLKHLHGSRNWRRKRDVVGRTEDRVEVRGNRWADDLNEYPSKETLRC